MTDQTKLYKELWPDVINIDMKKPISCRLQGESALKAIIKYFEIKNEGYFANKFAMACSGDGGEESKITTYHSSSLCALLFFYNVEHYPISIMIDDKLISFNKSYFEYKTVVIPGRKPSNMDVVLVSDDKKCVLFVESKFFEYIRDRNKIPKISNSYFDNELSRNIYKSNEYAILAEDGENCYLEGIKQLISHSVGINNRQQGIKYQMNNTHELDEIIDEAENIFLASILFDFDIPEFNMCLNKYEQQYIRSVDLINKELNNIGDISNRVLLIPKIIRYSEISSQNLNAIDNSILEFYKLLEM